MKRVTAMQAGVTTLALSLILICNTQAQTGNSSGDLHFGGRIGTTVSFFSNEQPHTGIQQGLLAGAFCSYYLNESMALQVEANYMQLGGSLLEFDVPALIGQEDYYAIKVINEHITLHSIDIPLLYKYSFTFDHASVNAFVGPSIAYNISANVRNETTVFTEVESFHTFNGEGNLTQSVNNLTYSGTLGLGLEVPFDNFNILMDVRYRMGLNKTIQAYSYMNLSQISGDLSNHSWNVSLGLSF